MPHGQNDEITDPLERMLKKTGCMELHFKVQECIAETQDWRRCQRQVTDFKKCMSEYEEKKKQGLVSVGVEPTKMVIIVRTDLKMGTGKIAAQVAHAAVTLYDLSIGSSNPHLKPWLNTGQPKIVLKINDQSALLELYGIASNKRLNCCLIRDAGRTQIDTGTITALGIGPNRFEDIDKLTKQLKLL